jgi:hypothetical protein
LAQNRTVAPTEGISFETMDLYDLPERGMEPFDVTLFKGIFYHLPDPITGLKAAADLTKELLILDTAVRIDLPDGMLAISGESSTSLMSGVYDLSWFPTGPKVLTKILNWMGFPETRVNYWILMRHHEHPQRGKRFGRMMIVASRKEGLLEQFETAEKPPVQNQQQELRKRLRERDRRIERLERQLGGRDQKLRQSTEKQQRLRRRTLRLKQQLQSMQASWCWRLVEVLRRTKAKILRVSGRSS